ncbi:MAG TPA: hypothetical protein VFK14_03635 [Solirubrobacterales bacterium]|nr:hypothetical protein [Solirubrobacterales bacterium]
MIARAAETARDLGRVDQAVAGRQRLNCELATQGLDLLVGEVEPHVSDLDNHVAATSS